MNFARLCTAHGVEHVAVRDLGHLEELAAQLPSAGLRVLEVATDRKADAARRKLIFAAAAASAG